METQAQFERICRRVFAGSKRGGVVSGTAMLRGGQPSIWVLAFLRWFACPTYLFSIVTSWDGHWSALTLQTLYDWENPVLDEKAQSLSPTIAHLSLRCCVGSHVSMKDWSRGSRVLLNRTVERIQNCTAVSVVLGQWPQPDRSQSTWYSTYILKCVLQSIELFSHPDHAHSM